MTPRVLGAVLTLPVLEVLRLHHDPRAVLASVLAVRPRVLDACHHRMRDLPRARSAAIVAHVPHDDRAIAKAQLGAMVLTDPNALGKPESRDQRIDRLAHVRVDEHRYDG